MSLRDILSLRRPENRGTAERGTAPRAGASLGTQTVIPNQIVNRNSELHLNWPLNFNESEILGALTLRLPVDCGDSTDVLLHLAAHPKLHGSNRPKTTLLLQVSLRKIDAVPARPFENCGGFCLKVVTVLITVCLTIPESLTTSDSKQLQACNW